MRIDDDTDERPSFFAALALPLAVAGLLYLILRSYYPVSLLSFAIYDDALFLKLGQSLAEGNWLGPFDSKTLVKGPGYPAFLALAHWSQLPYPVFSAAFHLLASLLAGYATHVLSRRPWLGFAVFALLLYQPAHWSMARILRDGFYADIVIIAISLLILALAQPAGRRRTILGSTAGLALGWAWLTREESIWLLPGLLILFAGSLLMASGQRQRVQKTWLLVVASALIPGLGFSYGNWANYGTWTGVDQNSAHYSRTLASLQSLSTGQDIDYLAPSEAARVQAYAVSPALVEIREWLEPGDSTRWQFGCAQYSQTCGDIAAGWIPWAVRVAAGQAGHYPDPATAERYYARVNRELDAACASGALDCRRRSVPGIPPMTAAQWQAVPAIAGRALLLSARGSSPGQAPQASGGKPQSISTQRAFLNNPPLRLAPSNDKQIVIRGWFLDAAQPGSWIDAELTTATGEIMTPELQRLPSPDLAQHYKDPQAAQQRFQLRADCAPPCRLLLTPQRGSAYELELGALLKNPQQRVVRDRSALVIERVASLPAFDGPETRVRASQVSLQALQAIFPLIAYPLSSIGLLALLAGLVLALSSRQLTPALLVATALWALLSTRLVILVLIDASSFPGLTLPYLLPVWPLLTFASLLSLWSVLELRSTVQRGQPT